MLKLLYGLISLQNQLALCLLLLRSAGNGRGPVGFANFGSSDLIFSNGRGPVGFVDFGSSDWIFSNGRGLAPPIFFFRRAATLIQFFETLHCGPLVCSLLEGHV